MDGAGLGVERLVGADRFERAEDRFGRDRGGRGHGRQRPQRLLQILDPAQAAARVADPVPDPREHAVVALGRELDAEQDAAFLRADLDADHVRRRIDQPLRQREAVSEILEIGGRRHHHRIAEPEQADRDRHLRSNDSMLRSIFAVGGDPQGGQRWWQMASVAA